MKKKIRVLYTIGTLDIGGAEGQLVRLVTHLNPNKFEPVVCCLSSAGPYRKALDDAGIPVKVIGFTGSPHRDLIHLLRLTGYMRRIKPDIVHGFLFWAYIIGTFAARMAGIPVVIASRRSLGNFKADKSHYLIIERIVNRMTDLIVANSEAVKQDVIYQEKVPAKKVRVIYNGIDTLLYKAPSAPTLKAALGIPEKARVVGVVANLIYYKGHKYFLDAWASVVKKFPESICLFVGDGSLRDELEAIVKQKGFIESVLFLGTRRDVPLLISLMDLVVHPSLEEGFSNAILEAMAAGKPVVATSVGGNIEAIVHGETGILVEPADPESLAAAINYLLEYPQSRLSMGEAGRKRILKRFGLARMTGETETLYEELIDVSRH
jgi:glycosyltransferase involved in cell wall biosynthesis